MQHTQLQIVKNTVNHCLKTDIVYQKYDSDGLEWAVNNKRGSQLQLSKSCWNDLEFYFICN